MTSALEQITAEGAKKIRLLEQDRRRSHEKTNQAIDKQIRIVKHQTHRIRQSILRGESYRLTPPNPH